MPWGYECRAKLIKQNKPKETVSRIPKTFNGLPSPLHYETPTLIGGKGYSHIRRAPAYTFGNLTPPTFAKPYLTNKAPSLNVSGCTPKGPYHVPLGIMAGQNETSPRFKPPGPGAYHPRHEIRVKRPPTYTMGHRWKPDFVPHDMWTPPPNMYLPPIMKNKAPAYTLGYNRDPKKMPDYSIQELAPKFEYVRKTVPAFSFGYPHRERKTFQTPAANTYCEKKFMVPLPTTPAPSFGIRHTPYLGTSPQYLKSSNLDLAIRAYDQ